MRSYAVIETGGRQYFVKPQQIIKVEKIKGEAGEKIVFDNPLLVDGQSGKNMSVEAEILSQSRGKKIIVFKKKRRKGYKRKQGHRQDLTELMITKINRGN